MRASSRPRAEVAANTAQLVTLVDSALSNADFSPLTLPNVKPILSVDDGVIHPIGKVRGRRKALAEFARVFAASTQDLPGLRIAIAHADAPEWVEVLTDLVAKARPQAEIELVENLGAVVGTHAGPGAVGFFWFQD